MVDRTRPGARLACAGLLATVAACADGHTPAPPDSGEADGPTPLDAAPAYDACGWRPGDCLGGCSDPQDQLWVDGYLAWLGLVWDRSPEEVATWVQVHAVEHQGTSTVHATLQAQLRLGWVIALVEAKGDHEGEPTTVKDAAFAFQGYGFPVVDLDTPPMAFDDVAAALAACEAKLGVVFGHRPWCTTRVGTDPADEDPAGVTFTFSVDLAPPAYAYAELHPWDPASDRCEISEYTED